MISQGSALSTPLRSGLPDAAPVGLVLLRSAQPGQLDPFHQDFVRGVESRLAEAGRSLLVMLQADPEKELHTYRRWAARGRIAGVLLMNLRLGDERVPLLQELGLPAVVIGDPKISPAHPTAFTDDASAMADAMRYLMGLATGALPGSPVRRSCCTRPSAQKCMRQCWPRPVLAVFQACSAMAGTGTTAAEP